MNLIFHNILSTFNIFIIFTKHNFFLKNLTLKDSMRFEKISSHLINVKF